MTKPIFVQFTTNRDALFEHPVVRVQYSHALKGNKNITHISFYRMESDFDVNQFLCDLPWVTSISPDRDVAIPAIPRNLLFINSSNNLKTFVKEIKSDSSSTYVFSDAGFFGMYSSILRGDARVLISFVAPNSGKTLILRIKHSGGKKDPPLEVTLGSSNIHLNPSSKSSLTIDDITLYPIEVSNPSDHLSFVPEVRNNIYIQFIGDCWTYFELAVLLRNVPWYLHLQ